MIRPITPDDIPEILKWWQLRGHENIGLIRDILPRQGLINEGYSAMFYYITAERVAFIEGFITNPEAPRGKRRDECLRMCEAWADLVKATSIKRWFVITREPGVHKYLKHVGAVQCGDNMELWAGGGI